MGDSFKLSNVALGTYKFSLLGGRYALSYVGTGAGTVDLGILLPDNATYKTGVATQITATTGFQTGLDLPPGAYEIVITGFTANYVALVRVPYQPN
jgi:hypothetical protein